MKKLLILFIFFVAVGNTLSAQLKTIASGLNGVIGIRVDDWGNKWVAESGSGAGDGALVVITKTNKKHTVIKDLPSTVNPVNMDVVGPWRAIPMSYGRMAVLIGGCEPLLGPHFGSLMIFNLSGYTPGTDEPLTMDDAENSIDIGTFSFNASDNMDSSPFSAVQDEDGHWYVTDAGANAIIRVSRNGQNMSVFAKFPEFANPTPVGPPMVDPVPTGIVALPKYGGFLVTTLTGFPFVNGQAGIYFVDRQGNVSPYLQGLTLLTDIAMDKHENIYVNSFGNFSLETFNFAPASANVIRVRKKSIIDTVATGYGPGPSLSLNYNRRKLFVTSFTGEVLETEIPAESSQALGLESRSIENKMDFSLKTFPNPSTQYVNLSWELQNPDSKLTIQLTDAAGRLWYERKNINPGDRFHRIDLNQIAYGTYMVKLSSGSGSQIQRIIVNH